MHTTYFNFPEIVHRFRHPSPTFGALHAKGDGQLQVQDLASGRFHSLRVLHHDTHRTQHHSTHDESKSVLTKLLLFIKRCTRIDKRWVCNEVVKKMPLF